MEPTDREMVAGRPSRVSPRSKQKWGGVCKHWKNRRLGEEG